MNQPMNDYELDDQLSARLAMGLTANALPASIADMRRRILARAAAEPHASAAFNTIRADEGHWLSVGRGVEVKPLFENDEGHSYLVRLQPGATLPVHPHAHDEECMVLEGELHLGEVRFRAGDYHVARAGSVHQIIASPTGGMMYIRSSGTPAYRLSYPHRR